MLKTAINTCKNVYHGLSYLSDQHSYSQLLLTMAFPASLDCGKAQEDFL